MYCLCDRVHSYITWSSYSATKVSSGADLAASFGHGPSGAPLCRTGTNTVKPVLTHCMLGNVLKIDFECRLL